MAIEITKNLTQVTISGVGVQGIKGDIGTIGLSGTNGIAGTSGTSGISGSSGTSGTSGSSATSGTSATSGINGSSGSSGTSGTSGSSGTSGTMGTAGSGGSSGTSGSNGSSGTTGSAGTSGSTGSDGTSGSSALWNFLGPYQVADYNVGDVVTYDGQTWYCIQFAQIGAGPYGGYIDVKWTLIAAAGSNGTSGVSGENGSNGTSGTSGDMTLFNAFTGSSIGIDNGLMTYTASLKSAITVSGTNVQIIGELNVGKLNVQYITSSVLFVTGSNIIGDQSTDKHEFTGSVNINDTLFIKGQAIGLGELNQFSGSVNTYTSSNDLVRNRILQTTASLNTYTGSNDSVISRILQTTASLNTYTGSSIAIDGGLMTYTASLKSATIFSGSSQIGEIVRLQQSTASLNTITGSLIGINNGLMAYTASLKAATLISSSAQITNLGYATTGSNVFIGSQTMSGSLNIVPNQLSIGDSLEGGKVAYILQSGDTGYDPHLIKGIIVATSDQSTGIQWYNGAFTTTSATGTAIGTGLSNTDAIIASQGATSTNYAAGLARAYGGGGYSDWYLPSKDELNQLYLNRVAIGGFTNNYYWSSTEATQFFSWRQNLNDGTQDTLGKSGTYYVRAVRAFSIPALTVVGNTTISGSLNVTGSVNIDNVIKLTPVTSFPSGQAGMLVASASYGKTNLYVYDGSNWKWLVTGSIA